MSRASQRRSQNAASLIRPSMVVKLCQECGAYGRQCYDEQGDRAGIYCGKHCQEHGHCPECGETLTKAEAADPENEGHCSRHQPWRPHYGVEPEDNYEL